ncbi:MAG: LuxR C-terminal-related transcriptional regulator [Pseudomonadales bacterium]|nr:LuxR C-terminal-related transcriptional regulator [Pseudomonadales bacterium]
MFPLGKFRATRQATPYIRLSSMDDVYKEVPRFLIISAPAGYGKSALAQDVVQYWQSKVISNVWLSLDALDADVGRFLSLLATGLSKLLSPGIDVSLATNPYYNADISLLTDSCVRLLNQIEATPGTFFVVLDDFHEVQSGALNNALNMLLAYWPKNVALIITSRTTCTLKLSKHSLPEECQRVGLEQLRFNVEEVKKLLADRGQRKVSSQWLEQAMAVTEGWPVAVQLASYQLKQGVEIALDDGQYQTDIANFFWEQIFSDLPEEQQSLLITCSFMDRFDASLLVAITENEETPVFLEALVASNLFLQPVKGQSHWYRVHATLRTLLHGRFLYLNVKQQQEFVLRAIRWCAKKDYLDEALHLCQQYELWNMVAGILRDKGEAYVSIGGFEFLHYWFEKLSEDVIGSDPVLILYHVWSMPEHRQIHTGNEWLDRAEHIVDPILEVEDKASKTYIDSQKIQSQILALRGYVARIGGCYDDAVLHSEAAVELAVKVHPAILSRLYMTLGQDYYLRGDLVASELAIQNAIQLGKQYKQSHNVLIALGYLIATLVLAGRFRAALLEYDNCRKWFEETGFIDLPQAGLLSDLPNDLYREMGDFALAERGVETMETFCKATPVGLPHLVSHIRGFRLSVALNEPSKANVALIEAEHFKRLLGVSWSFGWAPVEAMRAQYEVRWGTLEKADAWFMARADKLFNTDDFSYECEQFLYAEWLVAKKQPDRARQMLDRIACHAMSKYRVLHLIKAKIAQALLVENTDLVQAELLLMEAIKCAGDELVLGPFLEAGKGIVPMLVRVKPRMYQDFDALKLLEQLHRAATALWPAVNVMLESQRLKSLSSRQLTILNLLVEGAQDKVIARELEISPGTVKTHIRAIYRKLECNNRTLAVSIALEEGIQFITREASEAS